MISQNGCGNTSLLLGTRKLTQVQNFIVTISAFEISKGAPKPNTSTGSKPRLLSVNPRSNCS
jgi:hypothetical protein